MEFNPLTQTSEMINHLLACSIGLSCNATSDTSFFNMKGTKRKSTYSEAFSPTWLLLFIAILFVNPFIKTCHAGCRRADGISLCCRGKDLNCYGYTINHDSRHRNSTFYANLYVTRQMKPQDRILKRCYCDEHCVKTHDCCPDYRLLCHKPRESFRT